MLTPLATHFKLNNSLCPKKNDKRLNMKSIPCANVVGCLMYTMVLIRLDITHVVSVVSKYIASLNKEH